MKHLVFLSFLLFFSCKEKTTNPEWTTDSEMSVDSAFYEESSGILPPHDTLYDPAPSEFKPESDTLLIDTYDVSNCTPLLFGYFQRKGQIDSTEFLLLVKETTDDNADEKNVSLSYEQIVVIKGEPTLLWIMGFHKETPIFNYEIEDGGVTTQLQFGVINQKKMNKMHVITNIKTLFEKNETKLLPVKLL